MTPKKTKKNAKAKAHKSRYDIAKIGYAALGVVGCAVVLGVGSTVMAAFKPITADPENVSSVITNITKYSVQGFQGFAGNLPLIGTVAALSIVLALVIGAFAYFNRND